jgi:DNA repair exonuclease SbcCD ATPase subunit
MARMGKGNDAENEMIKRLHPMAAAGDGEGMVALLKSLTHEEDPMPSITELEEKLHQAEAKNAELAAEVAKLRAPEAEPEDVLKSLPEAIRKRIEDAEAKAAEAEAVAKRERDARQEREYIEKMQAYTGLPVNPAEDWRVLKALDALPAEYAAAKDRLLALLKAGDEAMIHANITKRQGHSGSSDMGTSAYGRIESQARELVSKGFSPTMEQAMDVVIQQFPSLYAEYRREQKGA